MLSLDEMLDQLEDDERAAVMVVFKKFERDTDFSVDNLGWVDFWDKDTVCMDGTFSALELNAILTAMRKMQEGQKHESHPSTD